MIKSETYIVSVDISENDEACVAVAEHQFGKVMNVIKTMYGKEAFDFYEWLTKPTKVRRYTSEDALQQAFQEIYEAWEKSHVHPGEHPQKQLYEFLCKDMNILKGDDSNE